MENNFEKFGKILDFEKLEEKIFIIVKNHFQWVSEFNHLKCIKFKDFIKELDNSKYLFISKDFISEVEKEIETRIYYLKDKFNRKLQRKNKNFYY